MGADLNLDTLLTPGTKVGDYIVERKLGEGGMGAVFAARHPLIGKKVAIKVLSPALASSSEAVERFVREARSVNEIGHRNIVDIFGFGPRRPREPVPVGPHSFSISSCSHSAISSSISASSATFSASSASTSGLVVFSKKPSLT